MSKLQQNRKWHQWWFMLKPVPCQRWLTVDGMVHEHGVRGRPAENGARQALSDMTFATVVTGGSNMAEHRCKAYGVVQVTFAKPRDPPAG